MILLKKLTKTDLSSSDNKRIQLIDSVEAYVYGTSNDLICKKGIT